MYSNRFGSSHARFQLLSTAAIGAWCLFIGGLLSAAASNQVYDVARDFDPVNNPAGVWTYGYSKSLKAPFVPFAANGAVSYPDGIDTQHLNAWQNGFDPNLAVFQNGTGRRFQGSTTSYDEGGIALHPGRSGEVSSIVWSAPEKGLYQLHASFTMNSTGRTDAHLFIKGAEVLNTLLAAKNDTVHYNSKPLNFDTGETIIFSVGDGGDGYRFDTTGLAARIERVDADANSGTGSASSDNKTMHGGALREASSEGPGGWFIGLPLALVGGGTTIWAARRYKKQRQTLQEARIPVELLRREVLEELMRVDTYLDLLPASPERESARKARDQAGALLEQEAVVSRNARSAQDCGRAQILLEQAKQAIERAHALIH